VIITEHRRLDHPCFVPSTPSAVSWNERAVKHSGTR
jgi:hypothetical protein